MLKITSMLISLLAIKHAVKRNFETSPCICRLP
jgi:hypothetical protein